MWERARQNKVQKCYTYQKSLLRFASRKRGQVPSMTFSHAPAVLIKRMVLQVQPKERGDRDAQSVLYWGWVPSGGIEMAPTLPIMILRLVKSARKHDSFTFKPILVLLTWHCQQARHNLTLIKVVILYHSNITCWNPKSACIGSWVIKASLRSFFGPSPQSVTVNIFFRTRKVEP